MAFDKKPQKIDATKLDEFLSGSKDDATMSPTASPSEPIRPDPAANGLSFADLMPPEQRIKKFPLTIPPALHRELTALAKNETGGLHGFILRTLAEKVMQGKNQK